MSFSEKQFNCHTDGQALPTHRAQLVASLREQAVQGFDLLVVGGGATGLGLALDASLRGFRVCLAEAQDFAQGTSSRATKLVHGGVRYLAQGRLGLVREALRERTVLHANAAHLVSPLPFVMPAYRWFDKAFYGAGLKAYALLAGRHSLGATHWLKPAQTLSALPQLQHEALGGRLHGGVRYWDAQFDDARLALALARSAAQQGALVLNHCRVQGLIYDGDKVAGAQVQDQETGISLKVSARCVVNATGVWVDGLRQIDASRRQQAPTNATPQSTAASQWPRTAATKASTGDTALPALLEPSQGAHVVVNQQLTDGRHAMLIPRTQDGRVLFAVPWLGRTLLGTTDTPRPEFAGEHIPHEPRALASEVNFILSEANRYFKGHRDPGAAHSALHTPASAGSNSKPIADAKALTTADIKSVWAGLRPLVKPQGSNHGGTQAVSREHHIEHSPSGLVTVTGGKWTTYRVMAEDVLQHCFDHQLLPRRAGGLSGSFRLVGCPQHTQITQPPISAPPGLHLYGSEADTVQSLPGANHWLHPDVSEAMLRFAVRHEYARTVSDLLARRSRLLFLDAAAAAQIAPQAALILREERGLAANAPVGEAAFAALAMQYGGNGSSAC
jgi:glycerol-3-phosphate dehydrogenase